MEESRHLLVVSQFSSQNWIFLFLCLQVLKNILSCSPQSAPWMCAYTESCVLGEEGTADILICIDTEKLLELLGSSLHRRLFRVVSYVAGYRNNNLVLLHKVWFHQVNQCQLFLLWWSESFQSYTMRNSPNFILFQPRLCSCPLRDIFERPWTHTIKGPAYCKPDRVFQLISEASFAMLVGAHTLGILQTYFFIQQRCLGSESLSCSASKGFS